MTRLGIGAFHLSDFDTFDLANFNRNQSQREKVSKMKIIRVGVDLAKGVFQLHGVNRNEQPVWRRKLNRTEWLKVLLEKIEPGCGIGMEACGGAHHWARLLLAQGFGRPAACEAPPGHQ